MIPVVCPDCRHPLQRSLATWTCSGCRKCFSATLGIPDLRRRGANEQTPPSIEKLIETLVAEYPTSSFAELSKNQIFSSTDINLQSKYKRRRARMLERGRQFLEMAKQRISGRFPVTGHDVALSVGCGVGSSLFAMADEFRHVIGIDPSLSSLILAQKAAEEAGVDGRVTLLQGYAQEIPLADESIDFALGEDVIEHLHDVAGALAEVHRVLRPNAVFVGNSVNRFNLLRPEPHVNLFFVGFLPRPWQAPYARWRRNFIDYDKRVHLISYGELRRALRDSMGPHSEIIFPGVEVFGFPAVLDRILHLIERAPPLAWLLLQVFPNHLAIAVRRPQ